MRSACDVRLCFSKLFTRQGMIGRDRVPLFCQPLVGLIGSSPYNMIFLILIQITSSWKFDMFCSYLLLTCAQLSFCQRRNKYWETFFFFFLRGSKVHAIRKITSVLMFSFTSSFPFLILEIFPPQKRTFNLFIIYSLNIMPPEVPNNNLWPFKCREKSEDVCGSQRGVSQTEMEIQLYGHAKTKLKYA